MDPQDFLNALRQYRAYHDTAAKEHFAADREKRSAFELRQAWAHSDVAWACAQVEAELVKDMAR